MNNKKVLTMNNNQHISKLGLQVKDSVTGFSGVITSASFDLYGCIQFLVSPKMNDDGTMGKSSWFDVARLEVVDETPVMIQPDFSVGYVADGLKGPADKPVQ